MDDLSVTFEYDAIFLRPINHIMLTRVEHSREKGRHLVAVRDIEIGEVLAQQFPYAAVLFNDNVPHYCNYCFRPGKNLRRCSRSKFARYCSREHQLKDWKEGYKNECEFIVRCHPRVPPASLRLAAHVAWKRKRELEEGIVDRSEWNGFNGIDSLLDHWDILADDKMTSFAEMGLLMSKICPNLPEEGLSLDEPAATSYARLLAKFAFNNHTISCATVTSLGCGIYPLMAMANHSSWPNCIQRFDGKRCEFRAIQPIKAGEEITITYVDLISTTLETHEILKKDYLFDLVPKWTEKNCTRTIRIDNTLKAIVWKKQRPPWVVTEKDVQLTRVKGEVNKACGLLLVMHEVGDEIGSNQRLDKNALYDTQSEEQLHRFFTVYLWGEWSVRKKADIMKIAIKIKNIQEAFLQGQAFYDRSMLKEATDQVKSTMELCGESLLDGYTLSETHVQFIRVLDLLRKSVVDVGEEWNLALQCYRRVVEQHDLLYPRYWSERGSQLAGLAKLESNYGDIKRAMKLAEEAVRILRVTDGSGEVLEEMKSLENSLNHEIQFRQQHETVADA